MIQATVKNALMCKFYYMLNKHCWVRLSNFDVVHSTGITRVNRHNYQILLAATTRVEFIFPEETAQIFSFIKYKELRLIHPKFSFGNQLYLFHIICSFDYIRLFKICIFIFSY